MRNFHAGLPWGFSAQSPRPAPTKGGLLPSRTTLLSWTTIGTVHFSASAAFQLATDSVLSVAVTAVLVLYARNGCKKVRNTVLR